VLELNKAIYGLKQSPREWYNMIDKFIISMGFTRSRSDVCLYFRGDEATKVIIVIYVDDIIIAAKQDAHLKQVIIQLKAKFPMEHDALHYYVGMEITLAERYTRVCQSNYINHVFKRAELAAVTSIDTPMTTQVKLTKATALDEEDNSERVTSYRSKVCSLMYAAVLSRPDLAYATNVTARFMCDPANQHEEAVNRITQYAHNTMNKYIEYRTPTDATLVNQLVCYVDTSHADSDDLRTTLGYVVYLNGGPVSWRTMLSKTHCQSPTESEYVGMFHAVCEVLSLRNLMEEIGYKQERATRIHEDNEGAIKISKNPRCHDRLKHIELKFHLTRDAIQNGDVDIVKIKTDDQIADVMTKALPKRTHWKHTNKLVKDVSVTMGR
jgi:hypothetical protein